MELSGVNNVVYPSQDGVKMESQWSLRGVEDGVKRSHNGDYQSQDGFKRSENGV